MNTQQPEDNDNQQPARDATLIPFPTPASDQGASGPEVLDGEVLSDEDNAAVAGRCLGRGVDRVAPRVVVLVRSVTESPRTTQVKAVAGYRVRKAPRDVTRLCWFALRGHGRWITKAWTYTTHGDLRADARAARLAGDQEARRTAQETIRADSRARWAKVGLALRRGLAGGLLVVFLAGVLALVDSQVNRADMWPWLATVYTVIGVAGVVGLWVLKAVPIGWLVAAVWEGRDRTPGASWLHRPDRADADSWIDERMISQALAHLGIGPLDRFFKAAGELVYTVPARVDGDGTYAQIRLPMGVTADMVAAKRTTLAANLGRAALETWPTQGEEAGVLDLWIADKGKLGAGAGPWPLQEDGTVDVFDGVPLGKSQRGAVIDAPLFESNYLIGGRPGQGKSAVMRTLLLGAALDPTVELWVFVMGQSPDFKPFQPRLSRYQMGMDDAVAEAAMAALGDLLKEMERRGKLLERQPGSPPKTSRKLADKPGLGLHLLVCAIDECHELFQHPKYGKQAAEWAIRLIKRGRKYGITLLLATQSPTKDSVPKEVTRNVSCGLAFSVGDHVANDGLLGGGKYRAGIRATDLRMKTDRGTCVAVGVTDAKFELVNTFYAPLEDGIDMVTPVINRAMAQISDLRHTGPTPDSTDDGPEPADPLADIAAVLGDTRRVLTRVVLTRLAELNPAEYEGWTFTDLKAALAVYGIEPIKSAGVMVVRAEDITTALTERDEDTGGAGDEETGS